MRCESRPPQGGASAPKNDHQPTGPRPTIDDLRSLGCADLRRVFDRVQHLARDAARNAAPAPRDELRERALAAMRECADALANDRGDLTLYDYDRWRAHAEAAAGARAEAGR